MSKRGDSEDLGDERDIAELDEAGIERYKKFHRLDPSEVVCDDEAMMPQRAHCLGKAVNVLYRSGKVDPETGKKPRAPQNYIHDHDAGVKLYEPCLHALRTCEAEEIPDQVRAEQNGDTTLVLLGECLGMTYEASDGNEYEIEFDDPQVELYCVPSGKALVVVEDKREILYLVWGGGLGVEPRGIIG